MFLITKHEMHEVIQDCLAGNNSGYYKLFWWNKDSLDSISVLDECLNEIGEKFDVLMNEKNEDAICLDAIRRIDRNVLSVSEDQKK